MFKNMTKDAKFNIAVVIVVIAIFFGVQCLFAPSSIVVNVCKKTCIYALAAVAMNLLNGFTGLFSLGQAGFMVIGAYTYAIFTVPVESRASVFYQTNGGVIQFQLPIIVALVLAGFVAALFAFLIGLPVLRLKSDYLAIATLGFAEIARTVIQSPDFLAVTNGPNPISGFSSFSSLMAYVVCAGICIAFIILLINSSYGRAFKAIRDDEIAAEAMGINLAKHKRMSFTVSSFFMGIAGALLAMYNSSLSATTYTSAMTYEILLIVVIGGIGSISGSLIASFLFIASSEWWLRFLDYETIIESTGFKIPLLRGGFRKVVFSVAIMIIVLFFHKGLMGDKELSISKIISKNNKKSGGKA